MTRPRFILDTDPGADDAIALLWLAALHRAGRIELVAITTTGGNVGRRQAFDNAARLCALTGLDRVPVARGTAHDGPHARHVHGADGLAGQSATLPPSPHAFETAPDAARLLADELLAAPTEATLIAIGPLTNLAAAEDRRRGCLRHARRLVVMGGALDGGNVTPCAEFNVYHDAPAWRRVLHAAAPDVIPLDVTRDVALDAALLPDESRLDPAGRFFVAVARAMIASRRSRGERSGFLLHDAVAVAAACRAPLVEFRAAALEVCTDPGARHGQLRERRAAPANARLACRADRNALVNALLADTLPVPPREPAP